MSTPASLLRHPLSAALRCLFLAATLSVCTAYADDYADVSRLMRAKQYPDAMAKAEQYLASKPRDPQMRFLKGVILTETGKTADAISAFTKITEDYPELPEPYNNLAVLYAGQSQFDKARAALEMAIRTNPGYATAHENLGDVYARLASQAYSKALQLDGGNAALPPKLALIRALLAADSKAPQKPDAAAPTPVPAPLAVSKPASAAPPPVAAAAPSAVKPAGPAPATIPASADAEKSLESAVRPSRKTLELAKIGERWVIVQESMGS